jgi:uncharacterized membrane protein
VKEWLFVATDYAVTLINWAALIVIVIGTVEAFFQGPRTMFAAGDGHVNPDAWLRLGRWLVAGLTFQLAADVLETASPSAGRKSRVWRQSRRSARSSTFFWSATSGR